MLSTLFTVATATVLFSVVEAAALRHSSSHEESRNLVIRDFNGFEYDACYTEVTGQRALSGNSYYDDLMTVEKCAVACSSFTTFGVEYGRECFCGTDLNEGSVVTDAGDCSFPCAGDASQKCGAGNRLNVYTKQPPTSTTTPVPTPVPGPKTYTSKGCFSDTDNPRAMYGKAFNDDKMTLELCAAGCSRYTFFGLEYYHECYCSNTIGSASTELPIGDCKYPCDGNSDQKCGGDWALNVYSFDASPSTTSAASSPSVVSSEYIADGCYTDSPSYRALTGATHFDDSMTIAKCQSICSSFDLFGLEYGKECYCGNFLRKSVKVYDSECSFPCSGDSTVTCGAGDRLNVYRKSGVALSLVTSSAFSTSGMSSSSMEVEEPCPTIFSAITSSTTLASAISSTVSRTISSTTIATVFSAVTSITTSSTTIMTEIITASITTTTSTISLY